MTEVKRQYSEGFLNRIFPDIYKKVNPSYNTCIHIQKGQYDLERVRDQFTRKQAASYTRINMLKQNYDEIIAKKEEESAGILSLFEQSEKKLEKVEERNNQFQKLKVEMNEMIVILEEKIVSLEEKKKLYLQQVELFKPCKSLIKAVTKIWPTPCTEFELLNRIGSLVKHKLRFKEEYREINIQQKADRRQLIYEGSHDAKVFQIVLGNKLDELEHEHKAVIEELEKEEELLNRMMDSSSEIDACLSEARLGCLRLFQITKPKKPIWDSFEQLSIVEEFGLHIISVAEALAPPKYPDYSSEINSLPEEEDM